MKDQLNTQLLHVLVCDEQEDQQLTEDDANAVTDCQLLIVPHHGKLQEQDWTLQLEFVKLQDHDQLVQFWLWLLHELQQATEEFCHLVLVQQLLSALQLSEAQAKRPVHVHVYGPDQLTTEGIHTLHRFVVGADVRYHQSDDQQSQSTAAGHTRLATKEEELA